MKSESELIYYKIKPESKLYSDIRDLLKRREEFRLRLKMLARNLGADEESYISSSSCFFGCGVEFLKFDKEPEIRLWERRRKHKKFYKPRLDNEDGERIQQMIDSLPIIAIEEYTDLFKLPPILKPGLRYNENEIGVSSFALVKLTMPDVEEITKEEFDDILKNIDKKGGKWGK